MTTPAQFLALALLAVATHRLGRIRAELAADRYQREHPARQHNVTITTGSGATATINRALWMDGSR